MRTAMEDGMTAEEAENLINQGWLYIGTLPTGKVILKNPVLG